ncbi:MAG: MarR family winged helix-turn-helix transcriptional regulator [Ornithinimicrobium sp.]
MGGEQGRLVLVCEAVHALSQRGAPVTVNAIAYEIGIDQSGASRLIKNATAADYLVMAASATDGRRREASLTPAGRFMLDEAHRWQESIFVQLTTGWSDEKRHAFQQAMTDMMDRSYGTDA